MFVYPRSGPSGFPTSASFFFASDPGAPFGQSGIEAGTSAANAGVPKASNTTIQIQDLIIG